MGPDGLNAEMFKVDNKEYIDRVWRLMEISGKKGNCLQCETYHGITLLNIIHRVNLSE